MNYRPQSEPPKIPFTAKAYEKIKADILRLTQEKKEVQARVTTAREMGDLSENGAYTYGKMELASVSRQLRELHQLEEKGEIVEKKQENSQIIGFSSQVILRREGEENDIHYTLVSLHESSIAQGKLSLESPLGQALKGRKAGDKFAVETPKGQVNYTVITVS